MPRQDRQVFDEGSDTADAAVLAGMNGDVLAYSWRPQPPYVIMLPSGGTVTFASIEAAREVRYVLNGLTLEGKL